jgi:predicted O-linked N-acetylglucosamine transferase (SPINDLY family)
MMGRYDDSFRRQIRQSLNKQTVGSSPATADELFAKAVARHGAGQLREAEALYRQILENTPGHAGALQFLGLLVYQGGQYAAALELIDRAIHVNPADAGTHFSRGNVLFSLQQYPAAVESYDRAIQLRPDRAEAYSSRGSALQALQQYDAAVESYDKAIQLKPDNADAYSNRGNNLYLLGRYKAAVESCDRAIALKPDFAEAYFSRGNAFYALEQYQTALESFDKAILHRPEFVEAHNNRGNALLALKQYEASLASYDKTILLKPDYVEAHYNRSNVLLILKQYGAALESYERTLFYKPDYAYVRGMRLYTRRLLCDWEDSESERRQLEALIERGLKVVLPFPILSISASPAIQRQAAEIYASDEQPERFTAAGIARRPRREKIRIGYYSSDYYNHPTSYLMAEIFELHDRSRFEVLGFSYGPEKSDAMSQRVSAAMDRFVDVRSMPDREVAELSRRLEVDIAVNLNGFTENHRTGIFAERAAPIQVNYLGYPGTMGAGYMDYLIADPMLIPESSRQHYTEKIVYLPNCYQPNDLQRAISAKPCARAGEGLPETAFVFCCFNKAYKITPAVFDIWMRILGRVEGSVLWLLEDNPRAVENLRKEAMRRGISVERLIFARSLPVDEHLARHRLADLFLDTFPYNAHTTASDALWAGLLVLTRMGESFASRVAASLLHAVDMPELVTSTEAEFEELAVELAQDAERRQALHQKLQQNRLSAPLFNSRAFTRHLEAAYNAMLERYEAGLPPEHIPVELR